MKIRRSIRAFGYAAAFHIVVCVIVWAVLRWLMSGGGVEMESIADASGAIVYLLCWPLTMTTGYSLFSYPTFSIKQIKDLVCLKWPNLESYYESKHSGTNILCLKQGSREFIIYPSLWIDEVYEKKIVQTNYAKELSISLKNSVEDYEYH